MHKEIHSIRLELISPGLNSRKKFNEESLIRLAESFNPHGILQPIRVKQDGDRFEIITGERRYRAAKIAGFDTIPCIVINKVTDTIVEEQCLIENLAREDLVPMDKAIALSRYRENNPQITMKELGKRLGISEPRMSACIKLASLPKSVHTYFRDEDEEGFILTQKHGEILFPLLADGDNETENEALIELAKEAYVKRLTCEQLSRRVKQMLNGEKIEEQDDELSAMIEDAAILFKEKYGSKAKIKYKNGTLSLSIPNVASDTMKSTLKSLNTWQGDEDDAESEEVDVNSDDTNEHPAPCDDGGESECSFCDYYERGADGHFICIKNNNQVLLSDSKADFIRAIKDGNTEVLSADLNCNLDVVAKRAYKDETYTVITDTLDKDICIKYKGLFTEHLRPILIDEYCINVSTNNKVVVMTLWGDCIKRSEVLTTPNSQATLCEPGEYSEFSVDECIMLAVPFCDIHTFIDALCLPIDR